MDGRILPTHRWRSIFGARGLRSRASSMIFNQFSKWIFYEFVNARFHLFVTQTREIYVFTRVRNAFWNIVLFAFHLIFGCSNHGMLILRPLAAQLSYLLIYWAHGSTGPRLPVTWSAVRHSISQKVPGSPECNFQLPGSNF